jgi:hypothetical protein
MAFLYAVLDRYAKSKCSVSFEDEKLQKHNVTLRDIIKFSPAYWLALTITVTIYSSIWSFLAMST